LSSEDGEGREGDRPLTQMSNVQRHHSHRIAALPEHLKTTSSSLTIPCAFSPLLR
jgi:hypothetical protein